MAQKSSKTCGTFCHRPRNERGSNPRVLEKEVEQYPASATLWGAAEGGGRSWSTGGATSATRKPLRCMYSCTFLSISSSSIAAAASSDGRLQGLGLGSDERDGAAAVEEDGETHEEERGVGEREAGNGKFGLHVFLGRFPCLLDGLRLRSSSAHLGLFGWPKI